MKPADSGTIRVACLAFATCAALGCASGPRSTNNTPLDATSNHGVVVGIATFSEQVALPADATFEALLLDVSRPDAPATAIGQTVVVNPQQGPISFSIAFDSALIDSWRNYAVRARILAEGRPLWLSDRADPVLTQGTGNSVRVVMRRAGTREQLTAADSVLLSGELTYLADVARLTECTSHRIFPVSPEADFPAMLRTYNMLAPTPGARLFVTLEGAIATRTGPTGTGTAATVVVRNFIDVWPNQSCAGSTTSLPLVGTPWRITRLAGSRLTKVMEPGAPQLLITKDSAGLKYAATIGCNGFGGRVARTGDQISFGKGTGTLMACGDALDSLERQLMGALDRAARWRIAGNTLQLRDSSGSTVALLEVRPTR